VKDPNALLDLMSHHKGKYSDKWNSYIDFYCNLFSPIRNQETDILEIGVENGGSLEIWAKFFPSAQKILGYDIDPKCGALAFDDSRIQVLVGDSSHIEAGQKIKNLSLKKKYSPRPRVNSFVSFFREKFLSKTIIEICQ
jgi:cephalosporin hydroxylase